MSNTIDNRIVHMKFDNVDFLKGAETTFNALQNLDSTISGLASSGLNGVAGNVESLNNKFSILGVIGATAISKLTSSAMDLGHTMVSYVTDPFVEGGKKRALNIEQARFQFKGLGMDVEQAMTDANNAVLDTAYGLDEAAVAAAQFGASGIEQGQEMETALRSIAGAAAMTGGSYSDVASIFTKVAGQGRLMGDDLNRLGNRGINAAALLAESMHTTETNVRKMVSDGKIGFEQFSAVMDDAFGEHAKSAADTYTGALSQMNSAIARISARRYTQSFEDKRRIFNAMTPIINSINRATEPLVNMWNKWTRLRTDGIVKALTPLPDIIDGLRRGFVLIALGAENVRVFIAALIAPIKEAFTNVFKFGEGAFNLGEAFTKLVTPFKAFTDHLKVGDGLATVIRGTFTALFSVINAGIIVVKTIATFIGGALSTALRTVVEWIRTAIQWVGQFTGPFERLRAPLNRVREAFERFDASSWESFKVSIEGVRRSLEIAFDSLVIAIKNFWKELKAGFLESNFYKEFQDQLDPLISKFESIGESISGAYSDVSSFVGGMIDKFQELKEKISSVFSGDGEIDRKEVFVSNMIALGDAVATVWDALASFVSWLTRTFGPMFSEAFSSIPRLGEEAFAWLDFEKVLKGVDVGIFAGVVLVIKDIFDTLTLPFVTFAEVGQSFKETLDQVTDSLKTMQNDVKSKILMRIAIAIGILALSVLALATVPPGDLVKAIAALAAIGAIMLLMTWGMVSIIKGMKDMKSALKDTAQFVVVAVALVLMATAILILASAVKIFAEMDPWAMAQGLVGVAAGLAILIGSLSILSRDKRMVNDMREAAKTMVIMAVAMVVLAAAVYLMGSMEFSQFAQGMLGIAGGVAILTGSLLLLGKIDKKGDLTKAAASMVIIAGALILLAAAVMIYSSMSWTTIADGLGKMILVLGPLILLLQAVSKQGPGMLAGATGVLALAAAVLILVPAIRSLGELDIPTILKGVGAIGATMAILVIAANSSEKAAAGAASMILMAVAIRILTPALIALGQLDGPQLANALIALALALTILGVAATQLKPAAATLFLIGAAIGVAAAGIGVLGFGLAALAGAIALNAAVLTQFLDDVIRLIPELAGALAEGLVIFVDTLAGMAPTIQSALTTLVGSAIEGMTALLPSVFELLTTALLGIIDVIRNVGPELIQAVLLLIEVLIQGVLDILNRAVDPLMELITNIINGVLQVIIDVTPVIVEAVVAIITAILDGIVALVPEFVRAALAIIEGFLQGIADGIPGVISAAGDIITNFLNGIAAEIPSIVDAATNVITEFLTAMGGAINEIVDVAGDLIAEFINGLNQNIQKVITAGVNLIGDFMMGVARAAVDVVTEMMLVVQYLLLALTMAIQENSGPIADAARLFLTSIANAIIELINTVLPSWLEIPTIHIDTEEVEAQMLGIEAELAMMEETRNAAANVEADMRQIEMQLSPQVNFDPGEIDEAPLLRRLNTAGTNALNESEQTLTDTPMSISPDVTVDPNVLMDPDAGRNLIEGLESSTDGLFLRFGTDSANDLIGGFKGAAEIHSPSRVFMGFGEMIGLGLLEGIRSYTQKLAQTMSAIVDSMTRSLQDGVRKIGSYLNDLPITPTLDISKVMSTLVLLRMAMGIQLTAIAMQMSASLSMILPIAFQLGAISSSASILFISLTLLNGTMSVFYGRLTMVVGPISIVSSLMSRLSMVARSSSSEVIRSMDSMAISIHGSTTRIRLTFVSFNTVIQRTMQTINRNLSRELSTMVRSVSNNMSAFARAFGSGASSAAASGTSMIVRVRVSMSYALGAMANALRGQAIGVGVAITQGMSIGLSRGSASVAASARAVANRALQSAKSTLGVASPSKEGIWLGEMFDAGMVKGIGNGIVDVERASSDMASSALDELRKVLEEIEDDVFTDDVLQPVIKPVLNLDELSRKSRMIAGIMGNGANTFSVRNLKGVSDLIDRNREEAFSPTDVGSNRAINYTQNNYSPKALTNSEIYRQTKNQLATIRGV